VLSNQQKQKKNIQKYSERKKESSLIKKNVGE